MSQTNRWIVVGGGASGLAAAYFLRQRGLESIVVERESTAGGRMGTMSLGGRTIDCGGKNIGKRYQLFRAFAASLGSHPFEYFGLNSSQVVDGHVRTFDAGSRWRTLRDVTRGVGTHDVLRLAHLIWKVKSDEAAGYLGSPLSRHLAARYDEHPASQYFSPAFCRRVLRPMSVRMNGAEPDEIFVGNLGSNLRMILDTYEQFVHGLGPLLRDFQQQYDVRLGTSVDALLVRGGRARGVRARSADGRIVELQGAGVIVATPASTAATLVAPVLPCVAEQLQTVAYYPVALVVAEYDRPVFTSDVRAFVFGDDEIVSNAGAYGINALNVVRYTFSGKAARERLAQSPDNEDLLMEAEQTLGRFVPLAPEWRQRFAARRFAPGLCAYTPHHARLVDGITREIETVPGLGLTGDYMRGASIEACFRAASEVVDRLARTGQRFGPDAEPLRATRTA
jgi:oxygen-dependent protoporphyrinogen oxidase